MRPLSWRPFPSPRRDQPRRCACRRCRRWTSSTACSRRSPRDDSRTWSCLASSARMEAEHMPLGRRRGELDPAADARLDLPIVALGVGDRCLALLRQSQAHDQAVGPAHRGLQLPRRRRPPSPSTSGSASKPAAVDPNSTSARSTTSSARRRSTGNTVRSPALLVFVRGGSAAGFEPRRCFCLTAEANPPRRTLDYEHGLARRCRY